MRVDDYGSVALQLLSCFCRWEWDACLFDTQRETPAFFGLVEKKAGAFGWALNESLSTGSGTTGCRAVESRIVIG